MQRSSFQPVRLNQAAERAFWHGAPASLCAVSLINSNASTDSAARSIATRPDRPLLPHLGPAGASSEVRA